MAVQAQHPSNVFLPDFRSWAQTGSVLEGIQTMQSHEHQISYHLPYLGKTALDGNAGQQAAGLANPSVFSDHQQSELTCNVSGSRKRSRDEQLTLAALPNIHHVPNPAFVSDSVALKTASGGAVSSAIPVYREQSIRVLDSTAVSTSGRKSSASTQSVPIGKEILAQICHHNLEIDALCRLQNERLLMGMEEARKRHCKSLLSILDHRVVKRLHEKETELENANRMNAELEEKIRQMSDENQIWFNHAKNNEAIICNLKASLEQVLLQNAAAAAAVPFLKEGYGDSDRTPFPADDAESCCFEDEELGAGLTTGTTSLENDAIRRQLACKACGGDDVCVLVLPCRHLCLCKDCEARVGMCPICNYPKNACLRVFMS